MYSMKSVKVRKLRWTRQKCGDGAMIYETPVPGFADGVTVEYHPKFDARLPWSAWGMDGLGLGRFKTRKEAERVGKTHALKMVRDHIKTLRIAVRMLA
jgi:hypothetical protein